MLSGKKSKKNIFFSKTDFALCYTHVKYAQGWKCKVFKKPEAGSIVVKLHCWCNQQRILGALRS